MRKDGQGTALWIASCLILFFSCSSGNHISQQPVNTDLASFKFTVEEATDWTNLFYRISSEFFLNFALTKIKIKHEDSIMPFRNCVYRRLC